MSSCKALIYSSRSYFLASCFRTAHSWIHFSRHRIHLIGSKTVLTYWFSHFPVFAFSVTSAFCPDWDPRGLCQLNCTPQDFCRCLNTCGAVEDVLFETCFGWCAGAWDWCVEAAPALWTMESGESGVGPRAGRGPRAASQSQPAGERLGTLLPGKSHRAETSKCPGSALCSASGVLRCKLTEFPDVWSSL